MKEFEVGDKVIIHKDNWLKSITYPPSAYGIKFDSEYRVEKIYDKEELIYIDGVERVFHKSFFIPVNMESNIAKPALEERKIGKVKMQLFDEGFPNAVMEIAKVMSWAEQNKSYKPNDFKNLPNADVEFSAAASRHKLKGLIQKDAGLPPLERVDEESGIVHLAHVAFNILAELELVLTGRIKE